MRVPIGLLLTTAMSLGLRPAQCGEPDALEAALRKVRPRAAEERWRLVPWGRSLVRAFAEARKKNRPVFFFGYDGVLGSGNC